MREQASWGSKWKAVSPEFRPPSYRAGFNLQLQSQQCQSQLGPLCRKNTFMHHYCQACKSPVQVPSCIQDHHPGCKPTLPWFSWFWCSDSKYLTFKSTFYSCKTLAFVCLVGCFLFFTDFVLVCSCCPVPLTILQRTSCSGSFQKASPAAVLMPTLFLLLSAFTWHEGAFWKAKRQCAKPLEARVSVGEAEPMQ